MKKMYCGRCKSLNEVEIEKGYFTFYKCKKCGEYILRNYPPLSPPCINMSKIGKINPLKPVGDKLESKCVNTRDIKSILKSRTKK